MEANVNNEKLKKAEKGNRKRELVILILSIALLLALYVAAKNANRERTIVVPPKINNTFWVDSNDASPEYLQEMSTYLIFLINNVSPSTVEYQKELFISKVNPSQQGELTLELDKQVQRIKRNNLVTMYYIKGFKIDSESNKVVITGQLNSLIGDKLISSQEKVYRIGYQIINGKLYVNEYGEVNSASPWGDFVSEK
jgi:conjugal transfer pilus assembly protein TraE